MTHEVSPMLCNSVIALVNATDKLLHIAHYDSTFSETVPTKYAHIWKTSDPLKWFAAMFNRTWEVKVGQKIESKEEQRLTATESEEIQETLGELLSRRAQEEEEERIQNMENRAQRRRIHGADRNNNVLALILDRFLEYNLVVVRDQILADMTELYPEDYPHNTESRQIQPELINVREPQDNGNDNGNNEF